MEYLNTKMGSFVFACIAAGDGNTCLEPGDAVAFEDGGILSAEEEKRKARLEAANLNKGKQARVIVLKQGDVDANLYASKTGKDSNCTP